jgi:hypothetical protein
MQRQSPLAPNDRQNTSEYVIVAGPHDLHDRSPSQLDVIHDATRASNANFARARVDGCQLSLLAAAGREFLLCHG